MTILTALTCGRLRREVLAIHDFVPNVYVHGTDGNVHAYNIKAGHYSSVVGGIASSTAGSVTITAIRARDHGPHASAGFCALARLRTGVHPLSHQGRK